MTIIAEITANVVSNLLVISSVKSEVPKSGSVFIIKKVVQIESPKMDEISNSIADEIHAVEGLESVVEVVHAINLRDKSVFSGVIINANVVENVNAERIVAVIVIVENVNEMALDVVSEVKIVKVSVEITVVMVIMVVNFVIVTKLIGETRIIIAVEKVLAIGEIKVGVIAISIQMAKV